MSEGNTKGVQILYTLFMGQPIKKGGEQFYDFLTYYFYMRVKEKKSLPNEASLSGIYGEFLRGPEVTSLLNSDYFNVADKDYEVKLREFRKDALKEIVTFIDPTYPEDYEDDFISLGDISYFFQQIAKTKIWNDQTIRKNEALIRELANSVSRVNFLEKDNVDNFYVSNAGEFDDVDWMNPELPMTKAYEYLEKENRRQFVLDEFKPYVDALDLTAFKKLLKDPLKRHFLPRGWQAEFLLRHKRFNRIGAARRCGKCRGELDFLRLYNGEFKQAKEICVGDKLLASDKTSFTTVKDVDRFQKECVRVTLSDGTDFIVSKDHRIPTQNTYKNGKWDLDIDNYTRAENLTSKDFVPTMCNIGIKGEGGNYDEGLLIGLLLGDGNLTSTTAIITCVDEERRQFVYGVLNRLGYKYTFYRGRDISIHGLSDFRKKYNLFGDSREKRIDNKIFGMSKEMKRGVINGLLYTDGYFGVTKRKKGSDGFYRKDRAYIEFSSVNQRMVRQLRVLMADVGLITTEKKRRKKTSCFGKKYETDFWFVSIYDKESLLNIIDNCNFEGKRNWELFKFVAINNDGYVNGLNGTIPLCAFNERTVKGVGHRTTYGGIRRPKYDFQRRKCKNYGIEQWLKYNWCKVVSVEDIGMQNVVHIEVDGDHTYWGEMDLTHNTFLGAGYLAGRQLMLPMQTVVYVVPTLKNHARPAWKALSHYFGDCTEFKMNKSDFSIVNKETKSEMYFVTAERGDSVRGNAANLMIFDEASFIDEEVFETAIPLIRTTRGMVYGISTVNPKTPKNWFYYKLIDAEVNGYDPNSDSYARRIDLWHNPFIPDDEKQLIYKDGMRNPNSFNCEWMVNFADKDSFDLSKFWIIDEDPKEITVDGVFNELWRGEAITKEVFQTYPTFIVSYDGAKRKDMPGITVYGVKPTGGIDMVMSGYLEGLDYYQQVDVIYEIYKMLGGEKRCEILMDYGGAGVAVHEIFIQQKGVYPIRFQTVGGLYEGKEDGIYKVGKEVLTGMAKAQVALGSIRGFSFMRKLAIEFETYTEDIKRLSTIDNHWDMISSMMIAIYWANKQGYLEKKEPTKAQQVWDGEFAQYNNPDLFSLSPDEAASVLDPVNPYERYERFGY